MFKNIPATPWAVLNMEGHKRPFYFDLQRFAEGDPPADPPADPPSDPPAPELPKTAEDLQKLLQAEADKRVTQALKTAQAKWEAELEGKIQKSKEEADKLAKLNAQEKEKYLLEKKDRELKEKELELNRKQLTIDATKYLDENKIDLKFLEYLIPGCEDLDSFAKKADAFKSIFDGAVSAAVEVKLKGTGQPWNGGGGTQGNSIGKLMAEVTKKNNTDGSTIRDQYFK